MLAADDGPCMLSGSETSIMLLTSPYSSARVCGRGAGPAMIWRAPCARLPGLLPRPEAVRPLLCRPRHGGQGGDRGPAPSAEGAPTPGQGQAPLHAERPCPPGRAVQGAPARSLESVRGQARDAAAMAQGGVGVRNVDQAADQPVFLTTGLRPRRPASHDLACSVRSSTWSPAAS